MALWIVHSWDGIHTTREGPSGPIKVIARHQDTRAGRTVTAELIATDSPSEIAYLRMQPHVLALRLARDGELVDTTEGASAITQGSR